MAAPDAGANRPFGWAGPLSRCLAAEGGAAVWHLDSSLITGVVTHPERPGPVAWRFAARPPPSQIHRSHICILNILLDKMVSCFQNLCIFWCSLGGDLRQRATQRGPGPAREA